MNASTQNLQARLDAVVEATHCEGDGHGVAFLRLREQRLADFDEALIARQLMEQRKALDAL